MNINEQLTEAYGDIPVVETDIEAKAKTDLVEQVEELDKPHNEAVELEEKQQEKMKDFSWHRDNENMTRREWNRRRMNETKVGSELEGIATDPKEALEYAASVPVGVFDAAVGTYNMVTPGYDIPQLPQFESQGAQFVRDISSILIPGMGWARALKGVGAAAKLNSTGRLGAFLKDPFIAWSGTNLANLGGGAIADAAAPIQGDPNGQTLLGSAKESFPTWFGWVPDNLVVLDGENPDSIRTKNVTEGAIFGATGSFVDGLGQLARGLKGVKNVTEYIPRSENAAEYFSKNKPVIPETVEDAVNSPVARMNAERAELGELNEVNALRNGVDPETNVIFGKDDILFDPAENAIRSSDDMGIVGAAVDQTRIAKNIDTAYGRVRNPMSEAALKFSLEDIGTVPRIVSQLGDSLRQAGEFDYRTTTGKLIKSKTIQEAQDNLAAYMLGMDKSQLSKLLGDFTITRNGLPQLTKTGKASVTKALNETLEQFGELVNLNNVRAMALTEAAFAGQVSDFAQQIRLQTGRVGAFRSMEQMLDRIEFLQDIRGMSAVSKDTLERTKSAWARFTGKSALKGDAKYAEDIANQMKGGMDETLESLELIQADTQKFMTSLRELVAERPNFLRPMATIYEMTDGNARSVSAANHFLRNKFGVIKKAFYDGHPEIPSVIMNNFWSQMFNSALSGIKTPLKAGVGNLSTWVYKPSSQVIGAFLNGDTKGLNRAFYAYGNTMDTINEGSSYMKNIWTKSAQDPYVMSVRDDIVYKTNDDMKLMGQLAESAMGQGNDGPMALYEIIKVQDDLARHPWLRVGNRLMGAEDGWLQAINGQQIARMRAYDKITENGNKAFVKADADKLAHDIYQQMFEDGVIKDEQVLRETAKQTFNQDNAISNGFRDIMRRIPGLRPFFMFTRTPINMAAFDIRMNPVQAFTNKLKRFDKPFEQQTVEEVQRLLLQEGVDLKSGVDLAQEYTRLRNEYKGAHALGASFVMMGVYGYLSGNITGNKGLANRQKQNLRRQAGWKPMNAFGFDYSQIPGLSTWLSITVDILDNATEMESYDVAQMLQTQAMVLGNQFTDRLMLMNTQQFSDVISGKNPARWVSNVAFTSQFKVAGMLGTMNQLMAPQLKAVEQQVDQLILNRIPGKPTLPDKYDWIDGGKVNELGNPLHRLYNAFSPFAYHETPSPVKQYLIDVEYDTVPGASTRSDGVKYTKSQQEEINRIMGEQGIFRKGVRTLMKKEPASSMRNSFDTLKQQNMDPSASKVDYIHNQLDALLEQAKASAELELPKLQEEIRVESAKKKSKILAATSGDIESTQRFLEEMNQTYGY